MELAAKVIPVTCRHLHPSKVGINRGGGQHRNLYEGVEWQRRATGTDSVLQSDVWPVNEFTDVQSKSGFLLLLLKRNL